MSNESERTHDPTDQRRERFRKEGRMARSRDAGALAATAGVLVALLGTRSSVGDTFRDLFVRCHGGLAAVTHGGGLVAVRSAGAAFAGLAGTLAVAAALGGVTIGAAQGGFRFETESLGWKTERLNPGPRLMQLVSPKHGLVETALAILRVSIVGYVAYGATMAEIPNTLALAQAPLDHLLGPLGDLLTRVALKCLAVLVVLSAVDYFQSWWTLEQQLKMTLQEVKDESKGQNGNPKMKSRMRQRARALARRRTIADVKKADVIVTNPTHVAVALRYTADDPAPIVVAKGHDEIALQIRAEGRKHGIPIIESRALARALDAAVPVGSPIGGAHFAAVAQVLAFVFRLRGRRRPAARTVRKRGV